MVKNLPANALDSNSIPRQEDTLEKEMVNHSSVLAGRIPGSEEPGRLYSPWSRRESDMT